MKKELLGIYRDWEDKLKSNEWYFQESYEKVTNNLSSKEAFNSIPDIISVLLTLENSFLIGETIDFLHEIYNLVDTTEIHPYIKVHSNEMDNHINQYADTYGKDAYRDFKLLIRMIG